MEITAEVTPHHLMFNHEDVKSTDPNFKMMPPLRDPQDTAALIEGLRSGVIDVVATDHAPHAATEKDLPFEHAMSGVTGLEWAGAVVNGVVGLEQSAFFDRLSVAPARIAGLSEHGNPLAVGDVANVVVFDPDVVWVPTNTASKSVNAPYLGRELKGCVRATIFNGSVTHGE